jgi:hypothetical protein
LKKGRKSNGIFNPHPDATAQWQGYQDAGFQRDARMERELASLQIKAKGFTLVPFAEAR